MSVPPVSRGYTTPHEEHEELHRLAERLRTTGDIERLWEWERKYSVMHHTETHLTMTLLEVLAEVSPW